MVFRLPRGRSAMGRFLAELSRYLEGSGIAEIVKFEVGDPVGSTDRFAGSKSVNDTSSPLVSGNQDNAAPREVYELLRGTASGSPGITPLECTELGRTLLRPLPSPRTKNSTSA